MVAGLFKTRCLMTGLRHLPPLLLLLFRRYPSIALKVLLKDIPSALIGKVRARLRRLRRGIAKPMKAETGQRFLIGEPDQCH